MMKYPKRGIGLFMLVLILTLPFYSASSMAASVQVTKNTGEDNIPNFIDAQGDTWNVEATLHDVDAALVTAENVRLSIGGNEQAFQSCGQTPQGITCTSSTPLASGIPEGKYQFKVVFHDPTSVVGDDPDVSLVNDIKADGSAPVVDHLVLSQNHADGTLGVSFNVKDKPDVAGLAVGIKQIDIINTESGAILQSVAVEQSGRTSFSYPADTPEGQPTFSLTGEGQIRLRVRAVDFLGHESLSSSQLLSYDFAPPQIVSFSLESLSSDLESLGSFIGTSQVTTKLFIDVVETSVSPKVKFVSSQIHGPADEKTCVAVGDASEHRWRCTWDNVVVDPVPSVSLDISATDDLGNTALQTLSQSFTVDNAAPTVEYFNTENTFENAGFISSGELTKLILRVHDDGVGITEDGIRADLSLVGQGASVAPTECVDLDGGSLECFWMIRAVAGRDSVRVSLPTLVDLVGNQAVIPALELIVDSDVPKIESASFFGVGDGGEKNYFQSRDALKIKLTVDESQSGMIFVVDMHDAVNDADTVYPGTPLNSNRTGFAVFTQDDSCTRDAGKWKCELVSQPMRSGYVRAVPVSIVAKDTAGNVADWNGDTLIVKNAEHTTGGSFHFELLGLDEGETDPDFWQSAGDPTATGFIDVKTANLVPPRVSYSVSLKSDDAQAVNIEVVSCSVDTPSSTPVSPTTPQATSLDTPTTVTPPSSATPAETAASFSSIQFSRTLILGTSFDTVGVAKPTLVLELTPFDAQSVFESQLKDDVPILIPVTCQLKIFSRVNKDAIQAAEIQDVKLRIPVGFTQLGGLEEGLDSKIKEARDSYWTGFSKIIAKLENLMEWFGYINNLVIKPAILLMQAGAFIEIGMSAPQKVPPLYAAMTSGCVAQQASGKTMLNIVSYLSIPTQILTCNPVASTHIGFMNPLTAWQTSVVTQYNNIIGVAGGSTIVSLGGAIPRQAAGIDDNLVVSLYGLCVPGIIKNLDRMAQIQCRYIYCLEEEVPTGIPVNVCSTLRNQLWCKYTLGEIMGLLPFLKPLDILLNSIKNLIRDPIGSALSFGWAFCSLGCPVDSAAVAVCDIAGFIRFGLDIWSWVAGVTQGHDYINADFCSKID